LARRQELRLPLRQKAGCFASIPPIKRDHFWKSSHLFDPHRTWALPTPRKSYSIFASCSGIFDMLIERVAIDDVLLLVPIKRGDPRGFFSEVYRRDILALEGVQAEFVQDNHVFSAERGTLRGLHFQTLPKAQGKLVRCTQGAILDVAVDIRKGSRTYGHHIAVELSAANWKQLWVPPGFAHGYLTLESRCEVIYKVTEYWAPECERG